MAPFLDWAPLADSVLDLFGEVVVYGKASGIERSVTAYVHRRASGLIAEVPGALRPKATVYVRNDAATGIAAAELDVTDDYLEFPERLGEAPRRFAIARRATELEAADFLVVEAR